MTINAGLIFEGDNIDKESLVTALNSKGDASGPVSATDGNLAAFDGPSGKVLKDSGQSASGLIAGFLAVPTQAGVPSVAPTGIPFNFDSTAVSGGLYAWTGAAWVKVSAIP